MSAYERGHAYATNAENCPKCGTSLQGDSIEKHRQEMYGATHFSRKIGIYSRERDRTVRWACPDCGGEWERT